MSILIKAAIPLQIFPIRVTALGVLLLSTLMALKPTDAEAVLGEINIKLTGTVIALGCTVDPGDIDKPVQLGEWATKQLKKAGETTSPVPFSIHLTGCSASGVTAAFTGTKDKINPELLALKSDNNDYATGIAVQIMDSHGERIPMGNHSLRRVVDKNGDVTLNFTANYVATENNGVRPGTADADTEFTLTYD